MAKVPSRYWRTLTLALTKCGRSGLGGICSRWRWKATVLSLPTRRGSSMQRIWRSWASSTGTKAVPGCSAGTAKRAFQRARKPWAREVIGGLDAVDALECQLLRQAVLECAEGALGAAAGLRREGGDVLDAELRQCPADLGANLRVGFLAGLEGDDVVAAAVGVEAARQAVAGKDRKQGAEGRGGALLCDQDRRIDRAGGVVERHHQVARRQTRNPDVARGVLVQHHPRERPARPAPAMRPAPGCRTQQAAAVQERFGPGVAPAKEEYREFRVWAMTMEPEEISYGTTQTGCYSRSATRSALGRRRCEGSVRERRLAG